MRKLLLTVLLFLVTVCTAQAATGVRCQSLETGPDGPELRYEIYHDGDEKSTGLCVAAIYSEKNHLLGVKLERLTMPPGSMARRTASFDTPWEPAYAKVFVLSDPERFAAGAMDRIQTGEDRRKVVNFAQSRFQALGKLDSTVTVGDVRFNYEAKEVTLRDGLLYLYGGGTMKSCSVSVPVSGPCTIKLTGESVDHVSDRTVRILGADGKEITGLSISSRTTAVYDYDGPGQELTFCSQSSGVYLYTIEFHYEPQAQGYHHLLVDSWEALGAAAATAADGDTIQLKGGIVPCDCGLVLTGARGLTICGSEDETTVLDFRGWSDPLFNTSQSVDGKAISLRGSGYTLKNFIIQQVPGHAITLGGEDCHHNLIENVVARYNHASGFTGNSGCHDNTWKNCDSYRNCDVYKKGQDADGFNINIGPGAGNVLINCRAFENGDDGYDNFANHEDVTYIDCYCWNNGNVDVFTGKYDFDRGRPVDRELPMVRWMCRESPAFAQALDEGRFELPGDLPMTVRSVADHSQSASTTLGEYVVPYNAKTGTGVWEGNGNGFKLASGDSAAHGEQVKEEALRTLERCIAFDHPSKGFDRNGGVPRMAVDGFFSFGNLKNYWSNGLTDVTLHDIWGYGGKGPDTTDENFPVQALSEAEGSAKAALVRTEAQRLHDLLDQDVIPGAFLIDPGW